MWVRHEDGRVMDVSDITRHSFKGEIRGSGQQTRWSKVKCTLDFASEPYERKLYYMAKYHWDLFGDLWERLYR